MKCLHWTVDGDSKQLLYILLRFGEYGIKGLNLRYIGVGGRCHILVQQITGRGFHDSTWFSMDLRHVLGSADERLLKTWKCNDCLSGSPVDIIRNIQS